MNQAELQKRLEYAINQFGLKAKIISEKTGLSQSDISRFKNDKIMLCFSDAVKLEKYFSSFNGLI